MIEYVKQAEARRKVCDLEAEELKRELNEELLPEIDKARDEANKAIADGNMKAYKDISLRLEFLEKRQRFIDDRLDDLTVKPLFNESELETIWKEFFEKELHAHTEARKEFLKDWRTLKAKFDKYNAELLTLNKQAIAFSGAALNDDSKILEHCMKAPDFREWAKTAENCFQFANLTNGLK